MISVKDNPHWFKDGISLINTNESEYEQTIKRRNAAMLQRQEIDSLKEQLNELKEIMLSIKGSR